MPFIEAENQREKKKKEKQINEKLITKPKSGKLNAQKPGTLGKKQKTKKNTNACDMGG